MSHPRLHALVWSLTVSARDRDGRNSIISAAVHRLLRHHARMSVLSMRIYQGRLLFSLGRRLPFSPDLAALHSPDTNLVIRFDLSSQTIDGII